MVNPVTTSKQLHTNEAGKPAAAPKAQPQQKNTLPQDTVKLSSSGDANHDGDSK
jgi:hypothetical protein